MSDHDALDVLEKMVPPPSSKLRKFSEPHYQYVKSEIEKLRDERHRLVEALQSVDWEKAAEWGLCDFHDAEKARTLLSELEEQDNG